MAGCTLYDGEKTILREEEDVGPLSIASFEWRKFEQASLITLLAAIE